MEEAEYHSLNELEEAHWWYRGTRDFISRILREHNLAAERVLDAGSGTGGNLELLLKQYPDALCVGLEFSSQGVLFARRKLQGCSLVQGSVEALAFSDNNMNLVVCIDVLYHKGIKDDTAALKEILRCLRPKGMLLIQLPAFEFLRDSHDVIGHTRERYTQEMLKNRLNAAGFIVERCGYRVSILFPLIAFVRSVRKILRLFGLKDEPRSDLRALPNWINKVLEFIICLDNRLVLKVSAPFGSSVFAVAIKPG